jgi:hypothetical protein
LSWNDPPENFPEDFFQWLLYGARTSDFRSGKKRGKKRLKKEEKREKEGEFEEIDEGI